MSLSGHHPKTYFFVKEIFYDNLPLDNFKNHRHEKTNYTLIGVNAVFYYGTGPNQNHLR